MRYPKPIDQPPPFCLSSRAPPQHKLEMSSHSPFIVSAILNRVASFLNPSDEMSQTSRNPRGTVSRLTSDEISQFKTWVINQPRMPTLYDAETWIKDSFDKRIPSTKVRRNRGVDASLEEDERTVRGLMDEAIAEVASERRERLGGGELKVPGCGLPLNHMTDPKTQFPVLVGDEDLDWTANTLLIREACMLRFVEELTNKPEWWSKVNDPDIASNWKNEALDMDWTQYLDHADLTPNMADACLNELRQKATLYERTGLIPVMDYSACVIKSDSLIPLDLNQALKEAVRPLEDVPEDRKDWHPGTDNKVLDLVHPSLYPLVYGLSRVLLDQRIGVSDALDYCGMGSILPKPHAAEAYGPVSMSRNIKLPSLSENFQWLPCDVDISEDGKAKISSYINNLHPIQHPGLYNVIEKFIEKALPAWDIVYRWPTEFDTQRLVTAKVGPICTTKDLCEKLYECRPSSRPLYEGEAEREEDEEWEDGYEESERGQLDHEWFERTHKPELPDMDPAADKLLLKPDNVKTKGFFGKSSRIQVIVKLANIHLTPEKPSYEGGTWHMEGQLNEHICATALFYYDSDNITDCHLSFRTRADREEMITELDYMQNDTHFIERTFSIDTGGNTLQDIGSVLTRPNRSLFFPNLYQHRVSPFHLQDPSRPGHRKILALFLVDPAIPVLSTSHVPPQQRRWWSEASRLNLGKGRLPPELTSLVVDNLDFPISESEAIKIRERLMAERSVLQRDTDDKIKVEWNFCEH